jgi:hypothetical protein
MLRSELSEVEVLLAKAETLAEERGKSLEDMKKTLGKYEKIILAKASR